MRVARSTELVNADPDAVFSYLAQSEPFFYPSRQPWTGGALPPCLKGTWSGPLASGSPSPSLSTLGVPSLR